MKHFVDNGISDCFTFLNKVTLLGLLPQSASYVENALFELSSRKPANEKALETIKNSACVYTNLVGGTC